MKGTIKSSEEITKLFESGTKFSNRYFLALYKTTEHNPDTQTYSNKIEKPPRQAPKPAGRLAFVAGKKLGSAPQRSFAKRRLREAARAAGAPWQDKDVALIARKDILNASFDVLLIEMKKLEKKFSNDEEHEKTQPVFLCENFHDTEEEREKEETNYTNDRQDKSGAENKKQAFLVGIPRGIALSCIKLYRHAISPLFPPSCRFVPTCSEYAYTAFERFGFRKGLWLSAKRIGRCHPLKKGGYDPVPDRE